jgi:hypothetical protein
VVFFVISAAPAPVALLAAAVELFVVPELP